MRPSVTFDSTKPGAYAVTIRDRQYTVENGSDPIQVELEQDEPLQIRIQEQQSSPITLLRCILWVLLLPFKILVIFFMIFNGEEWDKRINPYLMDARLLLRPMRDRDVNIKLYEMTSGFWRKTTVQCSEAETVEITHLPYPKGVFDAYFGYVDVVAHGIIALAALSILAFCTSANAAYPNAILVVGFVLAGIALFAVAVAIAQYFKAKKIYQSFLNMNSGK